MQSMSARYSRVWTKETLLHLLLDEGDSVLHLSLHQVPPWLHEGPVVEGVAGLDLGGRGPHDVIDLLLGLLKQKY